MSRGVQVLGAMYHCGSFVRPRGHFLVAALTINHCFKAIANNAQSISYNSSITTRSAHHDVRVPMAYQPFPILIPSEVVDGMEPQLHVRPLRRELYIVLPVRIRNCPVHLRVVAEELDGARTHRL